MRQREFWVVYDYGMGGVWGLARAHSEAEIVRTLPELKVVHEAPLWMTAKRERNVRSGSSFVVGEPSTYPLWLQSVVAERSM